MASYIPSTQEERLEMLKAIGLNDFKDLYKDVPQEMLLNDGDLNIPEGMSEMEVGRAVAAMAAKNHVFPVVLRGAGAYDHYIPSIVKYVPAKEEFLTAYTPYQAEMSQGILQSIFEYQSIICELTGMDVSNASVYDGATAAAEAAAMCRDRKRKVTLVSATTNPEVINTIRTYCYGTGDEMRIVPAKDGKTDMAALKEMLGADIASFYVQQPNFFGQFEEAEELGKLVHEAGAMYVMGCNPIALAIMKPPAECGADVAVGEAQPLGMPLSYGGPYLGFMATTTKHLRKLPGRIVGETVDTEGRRAFCLALQAREQHIRREKASSNICSNQALCALTAGVYVSATVQICCLKPIRCCKRQHQTIRSSRQSEPRLRNCWAVTHPYSRELHPAAARMRCSILLRFRTGFMARSLLREQNLWKHLRTVCCSPSLVNVPWLWKTAAMRRKWKTQNCRLSRKSFEPISCAPFLTTCAHR